MRKIALVKKLCLNCHKEFGVVNYRAKRAKYCSTKCNLAVVNKNNPKRGIFVKCKNCGKDIYQRPHGKETVCSRDCLAKYFSRVRKGIDLNGGKSHFKKGMRTWNEGLTKENDERVRKVAESKTGVKRPDMIGNTYGFTSENMSKEKHPMWKGGITPQILIDRATFRKTIRKQVLERDNYTCQTCGIKGGYLHIDHIQSWKEYTEGRFDINNCRTLCRKCHYFVTYGKEMPENSIWGVFKKGGNYLRE